MICQSGRESPTGGITCRTRATRRSVLVKVPSFSAKVAAGKTTSASLRGFGEENVLNYQEIQVLERLDHVIGIGIGDDRILPDDIQGLNFALGNGRQHLGHGQAHPIRQIA